MNSDRIGASTCPECATSLAWDGLPCSTHRTPRTVFDDMRRAAQAVDDILDETFEHVEQARQRHRQAYQRATAHDPPPPRAKPDPKPSTAWIAEAFAAVAPGRHAHLYRALASVLHPDIGGSEHEMQALNATYDKRRGQS